MSKPVTTPAESDLDMNQFSIINADRITCQELYVGSENTPIDVAALQSELLALKHRLSVVETIIGKKVT